MSGVRRPIGLIVAAAFVAAASLGLPGTPAQARTVPKHVAIYVAGVGTACADAGTDGLSALESKYDVTIGPPGRPTVGMVLFIGGVGSNSNNPNYWSYWHWAGDRWVYAGTGPSSSHPAAGSSDGWAFGAFKAGQQPPLPDANYASLCGGKDPTVAPTHKRAPKPTHSSAHRTTQPAATSTRPGPTSPAASTLPAHKSRSSTQQASSSTAAPTGSPSTDGIVLANALPTAPPKADNSAKQSGIPPWGTAIAIALVALLGGGAFWRTRARRQRSP